MENGASKGIENEENLVPESEYKKLEQRIWNAFSEERLKRTRFSKKRSALLVKKLISQKPLEGIEGTRIASALGVSRSIFLLQETSSPNKTVDRRIQRAYPANDQRCLPG